MPAALKRYWANRRKGKKQKVRKVSRWRRWRRRGRKAVKKIALAPLIGVLAAEAPTIQTALSTHDLAATARMQVAGMTGFDINDMHAGVHLDWLLSFWGPIVGGALAHKAASKLGVNRHIPFVSL
jgi:hypothetical protein